MIKQQICRGILWSARMLHVEGLIPDKLFLQLLYRRVLNKKLDLTNPKTFNGKLQWLKLYDRRPQFTTMVDKYAVKKYVADIIGEKYIIPTLGVWDKPEDIDWDKLPEQFVLKCTHDSGGLVICHDKSKIDKGAALKKLSKSLKNNYYKEGREWPYKNVPRRIIAEKYISEDSSNDLRDYKFFCFNGKVKCFKVDFDRYTSHKANYYDLNLKVLPFGETICPPDFKENICIPENIIEMIQLAEKLSDGSCFMRTDFYNIKGRIYFGEITLFPASGFGSFTIEEGDYTLGRWMELPNKNFEKNEERK